MMKRRSHSTYTWIGAVGTFLSFFSLFFMVNFWGVIIPIWIVSIFLYYYGTYLDSLRTSDETQEDKA